MQIAKIMPSNGVSAEYWNLLGVVGSERFTRGHRRDRQGDVIEVDIKPEAVIEFFQNQEFFSRDDASGGRRLCKSLRVPVSCLAFAEHTEDHAMNHRIRTSADDPESILTTEHPASSHGPEGPRLPAREMDCGEGIAP